MKAQDETRIRQKLERIAQWRNSGLGKAQWASQQGIEHKQLVGWLSYESRWRARLSGQATPTQQRRAQAKSSKSSKSTAGHSAFVAVHKVPSCKAQSIATPEPSIRIEYAHARFIVHWPMSHSTQLAHFLGLATVS